MLLAGTSAVLLAIQPTSAHVPVLVVYLFGALALIGLYGMLAPLLDLPPWRPSADMNRLILGQWRGIKWRRRVRRLLRRPAPTPQRVGPGEKPLPLLDRLVTIYGEGERLRTRIFWSGFAIPRDLVHGTARQAQIDRERLAREWDGRVLAALPDNARPQWVDAGTLPEHTLDYATNIAGVREFLAKKLVRLREIIRQLKAAAPQLDQPPDEAQPGPSAAASEWSPPAPPPESPGAPLLRAAGKHPEQRKQREHAIKAGEELARLILQAELQDDGPTRGRKIVVYKLGATVEAWARPNNAMEEAPKFTGDLGADLGRLSVFVAKELARLRAEQGQE
jgi:hypothetical protein